MKDKNLVYNIIYCDEYLINDKVGFLEYIHNLASVEVKTFPMIFYYDKFIGGYDETKDYIDKMLLFLDENQNKNF